MNILYNMQQILIVRKKKRKTEMIKNIILKSDKIFNKSVLAEDNLYYI